MGAFADDQLGLMNHLGIREFLFMGYCIGGCFALKLIERALIALWPASFAKLSGTGQKTRMSCTTQVGMSGLQNCLTREPTGTMATIYAYLHSLYRRNPDFVYSVSRDFARRCLTPMLVLPDDSPAHPYQTSVDIAALAPNAKATVFPWRSHPS